MVLDWLFGWRDRRWLERNGREHDIEIEDDLEEELSASDVRAMDEALSALDDIIEDYETCIYEVEGIDGDDEAAGRYNGRSLGRPQIEIDPSGSILPLWSHELGHDVTATFDLLPDETTLVRKTFDETVAYLTAYQVMDEVDGDEPSWLGPFRYTHRPEWDRLRTVTDPERYDSLEAVADAVERGDPEGACQAASEAALQTGDGIGFPDETSMVATYFEDGPVRDLEALTRTWNRLYRLPDQEAAEEVHDAYVERKDGFQERLAGAIEDRLEETEMGRHAVRMRELHETVSQTVESYERDTIEDIYDEVLEEEIEKATDRAGRRDQRRMEADEILASFADETYGYTAPRHDGYDDYLDLPHSVGTALAEELYDEGIGLPEIIEEPGTYADLARESLEYTVDHALDGGSREGYDPGQLV
jgi:hypothetical protein